MTTWREDGWKDCEGTWDRLAWSRLHAGFETAKDAAESLAMKPGTYAAYERRPASSKHSALDHQKAAVFSRKFKVSWVWLLRGEGTPFDSALSPAQERILAATRDVPPDEQERIARAVEVLVGRTGTTG